MQPSIGNHTTKDAIAANRQERRKRRGHVSKNAESILSAKGVGVLTEKTSDVLNPIVGNRVLMSENPRKPIGSPKSVNVVATHTEKLLLQKSTRLQLTIWLKRRDIAEESSTAS